MELKNYLYAGILISTVALAGCTEDKEVIKDVSPITEASQQLVNDDVNTLIVPINLNETQKQEYYEKYMTIVEKVNSELNENFELEPITAFEENYWYEVDDFEQLLLERTKMNINVAHNTERFNPAMVPKHVTFKIGSQQETLKYYGEFETQLNMNKTNGRQLFSKFISIGLNPEDKDGNWTQTGYHEQLLENDTLYVIDIGGKYTHNGIISSHIFQLQFDCDKNGGIS